MSRPAFLMTDASAFEVSYCINPWMCPDAWRADAPGARLKALAGSLALTRALEALGAEVAVLPAEPGLPDLVFPANAAVVLDGKVLLSRFRHPERRGEEPVFRAAFEQLKATGRVREIVELPEGMFHEGAGDALWDEARGLFWVGFGPRSDREAAEVVARTFGQPAVALELASERFYHLDTCFRPLSGSEILYYPPAFTEAALAQIHARVPAELRIEAEDADAAAFCVNAVNLGRKIVMAKAPARLRARLAERGYEVAEVDLSPFILSGGAAFCMTLRLDQQTQSEKRHDRARRPRSHLAA